MTRFVSHRSDTEFISLPTAASVDGYTSIGAPMIIGGAKVTVNCQGPLAVFGDLPALCAAPKALTAAGFGDLIAKLTSVSDWELGHVLWDEPFDPTIARRAARPCGIVRTDSILWRPVRVRAWKLFSWDLSSPVFACWILGRHARRQDTNITCHTSGR